jgi:hypothetical protein
MNGLLLTFLASALAGGVVFGAASSDAANRVTSGYACHRREAAGPGTLERWSCPVISGTDFNVRTAWSGYVDFTASAAPGQASAVVSVHVCRESFGGTVTCASTPSTNYPADVPQDVVIAPIISAWTGSTSMYDYFYAGIESSGPARVIGVYAVKD